MIFTSALRSVDATVSSEMFPDERIGGTGILGTGTGADSGEVVVAVFAG
jgi:hypothetical protein